MDNNSISDAAPQTSAAAAQRDENGTASESALKNRQLELDREKRRKKREDAASLLSLLSVNRKRPAEEQQQDEEEGEVAEDSEEPSVPQQKQPRVDGAEEMPPQEEAQMPPQEANDAQQPEEEAPAVAEEDDDEDLRNFDQTPRIVVHQIETHENCTHEVAVPPHIEYEPLTLRTTEPAKTYPFPLDSFQKEAINCIDNNRSVLVSAHTSAGKTVVALYAIAMALRDHQRVIYTSPIKALSNQKYRELSEEFQDVGLMTGDVTLNPEASCIVMTTEILRSMLYKGSEMMREVGWVVFDEIHYMRDKERGVVWEETIILLPDNVHYVFLSATIPNARQFAEWICHLHRQPCHVVYTDYRPTPLQHFIYSAGADGLYEVVNVQGIFRDDQFQKAMTFLETPGNEDRIQKGNRRSQQMNSNSNVVKIIRTVKERDMLPCIIFSFSRRECEAYAGCLKDMDFNDDDEKAAVRVIYESAINLLSEEDRALPQIAQVLPFLMRGIGIHHSGLLPILKEVTEILFGEGLIKTLFATETFAMGLNMPARTVVFTSARKFDGKDHRWITSGEYIQMSGRAGRRGKDDRGLVILMVDQQMAADVAKQIIKGVTDPLNSQFRLTYNMVLNLLRVPDINPQYMLEKSFYQFQNFSSLPELYQKLNEKKQAYENCTVENELEIAGYYQLEKQVESLNESIKRRILQPKHLVPFFHAGRLLKIRNGDIDFGWAVLINFHKKPITSTNLISGEVLYIVDVAVSLSPESARNVSNVQQLRPPAPGQAGVVEIIPFSFECVDNISTVRLKIPDNLKNYEAKQSVGKTLQEALRRLKGVVPVVDPIEHMKVQDLELRKDIAHVQELTERRDTHPLKTRKNFDRLHKDYERKLQLENEYKAAKEAFTKARSILQLDELACRKRVLRRMEYCNASDVITQKGRVACEVGAADELLATEMIFSGAFADLSHAQAAALLSCFVFEENATGAKLSDELSGCLRTMQNFARKIAKITVEAKLPCDEESYVEKFKPHIMDIVHEWCMGASFSEICAKSDVFEGSIIRCFRRLEELLREMINAAKAIGDTTLEEKFEKARTSLKRDIVFAASLYL